MHMVGINHLFYQNKIHRVVAMKLDVNNNNKINKKWINILVVLYIIALIWVIVFKCNANEQLNIDRNKAMTIIERLQYPGFPFSYVYNLVFVCGSIAETIALIFNIVCFLPMGLLLRCSLKSKYVMLIGTGISFLFEVYQLFSAWGGPDITDVILNGLGVYLGILLYNFLSPRIKSKVINTCALVTIVIAIPLDIFAIINSIINFPGF